MAEESGTKSIFKIFRPEKCCFCLSLGKGTRAIGVTFLTITLGVYAVYLVLLEDFRNRVLDDWYNIQPCTIPPIDTLTDMMFEYSIISNLLLVFGCVGCTRWLMVPWLVMYLLNIMALLGMAIGMFIIPLPIIHEGMRNTVEFQLLRFLGLVPLLFAILVFYFWVVVRSHFLEMGKVERPEGDPCCPLKMKTGVQILGGVLSILSGVILVIYFAKLDVLIAAKYQQITGRQMPDGSLTVMAALIILAVLTNILLILGGTGKRWRRCLLMPWLLFYGMGIIFCLLLHLYFTSLCWREEKIMGMLCLGSGFLFLILWSVVWIVAAELSDKSKTIISRPNPLGFQRL